MAPALVRAVCSKAPGSGQASAAEYGFIYRFLGLHRASYSLSYGLIGLSMASDGFIWVHMVPCRPLAPPLKHRAPGGGDTACHHSGTQGEQHGTELYNGSMQHIAVFGKELQHNA